MKHDDYIKRSDALKLSVSIIGKLFSEEFDINQEIQKIPSADVAEVRHGKWLWDGYVYDAPYMCNCCSALMDYESNFCPNCGARMEEWVVSDEAR